MMGFGKKRLILGIAVILFCLGSVTSVRAAGIPLLRITDQAAPQAPEATLEASFFRLTGEKEAQGRLLLSLLLTPRAADGYIYAHAARGVGRPTSVAVTAAVGPQGGPAGMPGVTADAGSLADLVTLYPQGVLKQDVFSGQTVPVHQGPTRFYVVVPAALQGKALHAAVSFLLCTPVNCTPGELKATVTVPALPVGSGAAELPLAEAQPWWSDFQKLSQANGPAVGGAGGGTAGRIAAASAAPAAIGPVLSLQDIRPVFFTPALEVSSLSKAMLLGFCAGLLLNLMPCVLPVLGIKLGSLLRGGDDAAAGQRRFRRHQLFFAAGIMAWFTAMTALFAGLDLAWGQIFQSAGVVLALALLLFVLALNLFGVLSLPLLDFRAGNSRNPDMQAFAGGVAATLLATPCSGPLLGGVLGWALLQPVGILALTLESVGLGMALPYLLTALRPSLAAKLPRPGAWMHVLEQALGFLLLGTVAYLVTLLPLALLPRVFISLVLTALAAWLWGQIGNPAAGLRRRLIARTAAVALIVFACLWPLRPEPAGFAWQSYTEEDFAATLGTKPMLVDFTADWCPTCKVMEAATLSPKRMADWQQRYKFTALRVDLTRDNPQGQALLRRLGSASIPVLAIFPAGSRAKAPVVLRDIVTPGQLEQALEQALAKTE